MLFVLISFVFVSILGMGMSMRTTDGQMSSCPFTAGQTAMCQMGIMEHIARWHGAFTGIPTQTKLAVLALALLAVALIPFAKPFSELRNLPALTVRMRAYQRTRFAKIFNPLLLAFSDGILNPKIYEPARI